LVPFPALLRYYLGAPYRWTGRALRWLSPAAHRRLRGRLRRHR